MFQPKQNASVVTGCDGSGILFWLKENSFATFSKLFQNCLVSVLFQFSFNCAESLKRNVIALAASRSLNCRSCSLRNSVIVLLKSKLH